jgi:cytochrome c oxidase subunit 1
MFAVGLSQVTTIYFAAASMIIVIPSAIQLFAWLTTLVTGRPDFQTPLLWIIGFIVFFIIGGLSGIMFAAIPFDQQLTDTYFVVAHFHYVIFGAAVFPILGGIYFWFPKLTGRKMSELLGKIHFWPSLIAINCIFMPMFIQGLAGVSRRLYDGGASYSHAQGVLKWNVFMSMGAWTLAVAQIPFIFNLFWSIWKGQKVNSNPWEATTLEWVATTSPPLAHGNFETIPEVHRGPYDYSLPGASRDFVPQHQLQEA